MKPPHTLLAMSLMLSSAAFAGSELDSLLGVLKANGTIDEAQYQRLMAEQASAKPDLVETSPPRSTMHT